jgi:[acyl-carrier-protein] S-malonyltransferase
MSRSGWGGHPPAGASSPPHWGDVAAWAWMLDRPASTVSDMSELATAVLFPGQGSQTPRMREDVERLRPDLLELVCHECRSDPFARVAQGTRFAQPAIFCASLAGWERLGAARVDAVAGHSLGEVAALVAAGCIGAEDGLRLVVLRGGLMDEAAERTGDGGMLAVLGDGAVRAAEIAARHELAVANDNAPTQVVLSGALEAIDRASSEVKELGLRAVRLPVAGAFHSPAMASAVPAFRAALADVDFRPPKVTVISCITAAPVDDPRTRLLAGLTDPVRWRETLLSLHARGIRRYVETGPGKVLSGLVGRTLNDVVVETAQTLEATHA